MRTFNDVIATMQTSSPIIYFLAGALLPTLAYILLSSNKRKKKEEWIEEEEDDSFEPAEENNGNKNWGMKDAPYKMVLCVNQELGMGKGKIAAQCCHAAVGCYKRALKQCPDGVRAWEMTGCAKIAVKCPTESEMEVILVKAYERNIPLYLVEDAGRTQIAAGSRTVLGLGPAPVSVFEGVTSHLKLM